MNEITQYDPRMNELNYFKTIAQTALKSGGYSMTEAMMLNIMLTAKDLGISPLKALNGGFYVVNGKISMSTALMTDRIRKEGHSIQIKEWTSDKCIIVGKRKDNGDTVCFEFTMEDATRAGLVNSATWKKFPKQMLYNRAMSTLARTLFPDVVGNAYSEDEKHDILNIPAKDRPLEDPDSITVESSVVEDERISPEQLSNILDIVFNDQARAKKLLAHYEVEVLEELPFSKYEEIMKILTRKSKVQEEKVA